MRHKFGPGDFPRAQGRQVLGVLLAIDHADAMVPAKRHEPGQLAYPWGVAIDKRDRVVAVDAGNNRLQVFEF